MTIAEFEDAVAVGGEVFVVGDGDDRLMAGRYDVPEDVEDQL